MDRDTAPTCDVCAKPIPDTAYVCPRCGDAMRDHLASVTALASEIETTVARLARYGDRGGRRAVEVDEDTTRPTGGLRPTALPFNPGARRQGDEAINAITTWARHISEWRGVPVPPQEPSFGPLCGSQGVCRHESCSLIHARTVEHPAARAARFVTAHLNWLRHQREAGEAFQEMTLAARTIVRVVDAPPALWYAGPCWEQPSDQYGPTGGRCDGELYARANQGTVRCPSCGSRHDVAERRVWLLQEADAVLAHAALIAAALSVLDRPVTSSQVRNLAHRGRIAQHGQDHQGRPLYRVGEVRVVLADIDYRRGARAAA